MARYFKYKSPADLTADAARLGHALEVADDLGPLFTPVAIGELTVGNRLAIHPMEGCDGFPDGRPDELTYRRYRRFGAGGAKLIWGEATAIADEGRMNPRQLWLNDRTAGDLETMLAGCRTAHREQFGSDAQLIVGLQLTHSGRYSFRKPLVATHDPILDPFTLDKSTGRPLDASYPLLSDDDLKRIEDQFVAAARLAEKIGLDFIDLKQCHRYLLSELLAAKNRPGAYGGSLENRTRLIRNILGRIRSETPRLLLASRMNAYDGIPYRGEGTGEEFIGQPCPHELPLQTAFGTNPRNHLEEDLSEPLEVARMLRDAGLGLLSITMGNPYANPHVVRPAEFPPVDGYHCPEHPLHGVARHFRIARQIQAAIPKIPVIGGGYSWLQDYALGAAAANIAAGHVALIGLGRAALSHPEFARTAQETGSLNRKLVCRTFSYCTGLMRAKNHPLGQFPTGCPPFDKEVYGPVWKEVEAQRNPPKEQ
jgi:2,4-dienoyl-CoA reductase-like NADH-dependent reductase (Old Yellow Enzyme family)